MIVRVAMVATVWARAALSWTYTYARAGNVDGLWTLLIRYPLLALVPAAVFFVLAARNGRRFNLVVGGIWTSYALYELGVSLRILCSGECNIRADLILFYPVLAVLSLIGIAMAFRGVPGR